MKFIIRLEGGLGNQLFQYAHARALQTKYGGELYWDLHAYNAKQIRSLSLHHFNIAKAEDLSSMALTDKLKLRLLQLWHKILFRANVRSWISINQNKYAWLATKGIFLQYQIPVFQSFVKPHNNVNYVSGNYLSEGFFAGAEEILRKELKVVEPISDKSQPILKQISSSNSVCLHVRLGDYLAPEWKDKLYICTPEYYVKAVELMKQKVKNPKFFIFSNRPKDFEWIKENIHLEAEIVYVNLGNTDYEDMKLMYSCKHFIMSNSTYSWWAQWLGSDPHKVVIAPSRFNNFPGWDMSGIYLPEWDLIKL